MSKVWGEAGRPDRGRAGALALAASLAALGCSKKADLPPPAPTPVASAPAAASSASPEFDKKWSTLAQKDVDVFYVEDDRGDGLMGNVRRARREQDLAPAAPPPVDLLPATPSQEAIQLVIKQNLPGVKACYLRISRDGEPRSGKAIVSFEIGAGGEVIGTKVDAPAFQGTSLPGCVSGMVSRWAFPKSQNGALAISYPFVFVGG
jgi:hypothetical protein